MPPQRLGSLAGAPDIRESVLSLTAVHRTPSRNWSSLVQRVAGEVLADVRRMWRQWASPNPAVIGESPHDCADRRPSDTSYTFFRCHNGKDHYGQEPS